MRWRATTASAPLGPAMRPDGTAETSLCREAGGGGGTQLHGEGVDGRGDLPRRAARRDAALLLHVHGLARGVLARDAPRNAWPVTAVATETEAGV